VAGLTWPLPAGLTDGVLEDRPFARNDAPRGVRRRAEPVWSKLVCELKCPGVNLMVLREEYRAKHPEGYSRFCDLFREFEARLSPVMRQEHRAGDKVFVSIIRARSFVFQADNRTSGSRFSAHARCRWSHGGHQLAPRREHLSAKTVLSSVIAHPIAKINSAA
jgi:hypothetical protein